MAKHISLEDIERRLGPQTRPSYEEDLDVDHEQDEDSEGMGVGFIAKCIGTFVAVALGTFFFSGGNLNVGVPSLSLAWHEDLKSSMDPICSVGWLPNRSNRDQMHCYFTKNIARFCKPEERKHLIAQIKKFDEAHMISKGTEIASVFQNAGGGMSNPNIAQLGIQGTRASDRSLSEEDQMRAMDQAVAAADRINAPIMKVLERSRNDASMDDIKTDVAQLVKYGYFTAGDFGYFRPQWIRNAVDNIPAGTSPCNKS